MKSESAPTYVKFSGKKVLFKPEWERAIDIIGLDEITPEKITVLNAIISGYKFDLARHGFNYLGTFILKVITPEIGVITCNIGYGFLIRKLLRRKGIELGTSAEIHFHAYLFRTTIKGTKKRGSKKVASTTTEQLISLNAPLTIIKRKRVQNQFLLLLVLKKAQ